MNSLRNADKLDAREKRQWSGYKSEKKKKSDVVLDVILDVLVDVGDC